MPQNRERGQMEAIKPYKKDADYSYTLGAFPSIELIKARPERVRVVYCCTDYSDKAALAALCAETGLPLVENDKLIRRLCDKENVYVIAAFEKYEEQLSIAAPHIVLVNPGNMGNVGTILRTALGFGFFDVAVIRPAADLFHPKTVRASMGALFSLRHAYYDTFAAYRAEFPQHALFPFLLRARRLETPEACEKPALFSLIFGNEATGLDATFEEVGTGVRIPQTAQVDSLNVTVAAGIGMYAFAPVRAGVLDKRQNLL